MARFGDRSYSFTADGHWLAGAMRSFAVADGGLAVTQQLKVEPIEPREPGVLAAAGPCGRLAWLRPDSGELVELHSFGAEPQGRIAVQAPVAIHAGPVILWVRHGARLRRFAARGLQELGTTEVGNLVASASDGGDGLWLLTRGRRFAEVRWLDAHGRFGRRPIELREGRAPLALTCDPVRRRLAILDARTGEREWRLHVLDLAKCKVQAPLVFPLAKGDPLPAWIAVGEAGEFWLPSAKAPGKLIAVSANGIEAARQDLILGNETAIAGVIWQDGLVVCTAEGLYRITPATSEDDETGPAAVFVTPALRSPPGTPSGWNRAEIKVEVPQGALLTATILASSSADIVERFDELLTDPATPVSARIAEIETLFDSPEVTRREQVYKCHSGEQLLHLLLDRIAAPYLWLKLEIACPHGAGPAILRRLRVRYPDRSWLDDLPAIYRDEPASAAQLRQFLAPFETLYGEIDEVIDGLAAQIHPATAPDERLSWLLGWLGFPPTTGLPAAAQRELLQKAGELLQKRGTLEALRDVLRIATGNPVTVEDAATARFWIIGAHPARFSARLGRDTRAVARLPGGFRLGKGMRLGEEPLTPFCSDIDRMQRARCGLVTIRIGLDPATRDVVRPIVESLLAMFVPAHCRIDLSIVPAGRTRRGGRLDGNWNLAEIEGAETPGTARLHDPNGIELGAETELGAWQLPSGSPPPFTLDGTAALDGAGRLA